MKLSGRERGYALLVILISVFMLVSQAQAEVPELKPVSKDLPLQVQARLAKKAAMLKQDLFKLAERNEALKKNCVDVNEGSPEAERCGREQAALEAGTDRYAKEAVEFNRLVDDAVAANLEKKILHLKEQIEKDQDAIRRLGFDSRAGDFQEWENLSKEARSRFEEQVLDSFIDVLFSSASEANKAVISKTGSLNTFSSRKLIKKLDAKGIKNQRLRQMIREIGAAKGKPGKAKAAKEMIELVEKEGDLLGIAQDASEDPGGIRTGAEAAITVLSWGLEGPLAGSFSGDVQFMFASLYNNAARRVSTENIERLMTLTERQLKDLNVLTVTLKKHVKELRKARAALDELRKGETL